MVTPHLPAYPKPLLVFRCHTGPKSTIKAFRSVSHSLDWIHGPSCPASSSQARPFFLPMEACSTFSLLKWHSGRTESFFIRRHTVDLQVAYVGAESKCSSSLTDRY